MRVLLKSHRQPQRGSAALESLMLLVFLIIPLWGLIFTMGYLGIRVQKTHEALSLSTYMFLLEREAGTDNPASSAQSTVSGSVFAGETNPLQVNVNDQEAQAVADEVRGDEDLSTLQNLMGSLSGRSNIAVSVTRQDPIGNFDTSPIRRAMVIGGPTGTFCQMQDESLNPFEAGDISSGVTTLVRLLGRGSSYILFPFGGLPPLGSSPRCD